jgi:hypothetical protein
MAKITAAEMARSVGVDPKTFRAALRKAITWHPHNGEWKVDQDSTEHVEMIHVLRAIFARRAARG